MDQTDGIYAHVDQPAFEQMQIDQNISRVAIFFVCFLTIGVFYFTLVNFPIARLLPIQQLEQVGQLANSLNPAASRAPASKPAGALGGSQIGASAVPSASAAPSVSAAAAAAAPPSAAPSAAPSTAAAKPSVSAAAAPALSGNTYTVESGDTLSAIARKFNVSAQSIADANKMTTNATLTVGQKLTIPK
jgi:LysM repeat protein